ncbi:LLM class flavin-dependent oxidoreductase [Micromonospora echinospora]|uniref:LLM class flavin-dependent oxidoreductase n=1 Tax=Micromonospora echinospora TaxID=1877 RepID=UPI0037A6F649
MRVGVVVLPEHRWTDALSIWSEVEELGFSHAWTYDHLSWRSLRGGPWYSPVPTLTAAAAATSRITIGTLVTSPNLRHPVTWAQDVMTIDEISGGRFVAGIGAGGGGHDAAVLGMPHLSPSRRHKRFREFIELGDLLLTEKKASYHGEYYTAVDACLAPGCVQRPRVPFAIAAAGRHALALAARYAQIWVTNGDPTRFGELSEKESWAVIRAQREIFEESCHREGRDPALVARMLNGSVIVGDPLSSVERFIDFVGRSRDEGFTDVVIHYPRRSEPFKADHRVFEKIAEVWRPALGEPTPA